MTRGAAQRQEFPVDDFSRALLPASTGREATTSTRSKRALASFMPMNFAALRTASSAQRSIALVEGARTLQSRA